MSMSLATTQMLSQHLATMSARIGLLQTQVGDLTKAGGSKSAEDSAKSEVELVERVESVVSKNVRVALAGDIRDAMVRERQVVEDKIVQSVSLVSEDVQVQVQGLSDSVKGLSDSVKALSASSAAAAASLKALEETWKTLSETTRSMASDVAGLVSRVADLEKAAEASGGGAGETPAEN